MRVEGPGSQVEDSGLNTEGFRVNLRVQGSGFGFQDVGGRVQGSVGGFQDLVGRVRRALNVFKCV